MIVAAKSIPPKFAKHPPTLSYLLAVEFCESFAYWGVLSLLVLYMRDELLVHAGRGRILGFTTFVGAFGLRSASVGRTASTIIGVFNALIWLAPIFGGLIADRWLGRTRTIVLGAAAMTAGHLLLSFDATFLIALLSLVIGLGFFKANITGQVGELYDVDDPRRGSAFSLLLICANLSGIAAPLICGTVAQYVGWHWAFATSATVMLIGLLAYLAGRKHLPRLTSASSKSERRTFSKSERRSVFLLVLLLIPLSVTQLSNFQLFNSYQVWAQQYYQLRLAGRAFPVAWLLSFDNMLVIIMIAAVTRFWFWWDKRYRTVDDLTKIAFATVLSAAAPLLLAALTSMAHLSGQKVPILWAIPFHLLNDTGFAIMVPAGWSLYTRVAPGLTGFLVGLYSIHLFFTNLLVAWLGGLFDSMNPVTFWLTHAGVMVVGAMVLFLVRGAVVIRGAGRNKNPALSDAVLPLGASAAKPAGAGAARD